MFSIYGILGTKLFIGTYTVLVVMTNPSKVYLYIYRYIFIFYTHKIIKFLFFSFTFLPTSVPAESSLCKNNVVEETVQNSVGPGFSINKEKYDICEMMFSMEKGGCAVAQAEAGRKDSGVKDKKDTEKDGAAKNCPPPDTSKTGQAPWQEGVLERLGQELSPQEYNMYVVHHGRMLLTFGQIQACTPRDKDFVYGSLEPIPVQTLRSFKVMISSYIYLL